MRLKAGAVLLSLLLLTVLAGASSAVCVEPPANIISWWTADGTPEDLAETNDGTLLGGMGFAAGVASQGFEFDGVDDYVDAGNGIFARPDFPFSVDFWINMDTASSFYAITSSATAGNGLYAGFLVSVNSSGTVISGIGNDLGCCTSAYRRNFFSPSGAVTVGNWHHVAVVFVSATSHLIYVDGAAQVTTSSGTATTMTYGASNALQLGRVFEPNSQTYIHANGRLDEVELHGGIMDPGKILEIYQAGSDGKCKDSPIATDSHSWSTVKATFDRP